MNSTDIDLANPDITDVDRGMKLLLQSAEAHEREHGSDFCETTRAQMVAFVMLNMGLELGAIGEVAEAFMDMILADANEPVEWADVISDGEENE